MPSKAVQTNNAPLQRLARPCRLCEMELRIQWIYTVHSLLNIWVFRLWGPKLRNKAFWGIVSVAAVVGLHRLSDEPYYCRAGMQETGGRHFWGRAAEGGMIIVRFANDGARDLAAWFGERCNSSMRSDKMQRTEEQPEVKPEVKREVRPQARAEQTEEDYDLCDLD